MNLIDIIIATILGFCLIRGIFRGFVKEISSIIGVIAGFYAAYSYYGLIVKPLSKWISNTPLLNLLSFFILFCCVFLIISFMGVILKYLLKITYLGWFDRICGSLFGIIKGGLIVSVLVLALTVFLPKNAEILIGSFLAPKVTIASEYLIKVTPHDLKRQFALKSKELKKYWKRPR